MLNEGVNRLFQTTISVVKDVRDPICLTTEQELPVYINHAFRQLTGYSSLQAFLNAGGMHTLRLLEAETRTETNPGHGAPLWKGKAQLKTLSDSQLPVRLTITPLHDSAGALYGHSYLFLLSPLPPRAFAYNLLLDNFLQHAKDVIMITEARQLDKPGPCIVYVNPAFTELTGYSAEEALGRSPRMLQGPKTDRQQLQKLRKALEKQEPVQVELLNYRKNGEEFWVEFSVVPIYDEEGALSHFFSIQRETTHRKQAQLALQVSQQELERSLYENKQILDNSRDIICTINQEGRYVQVSQASERILGYTPEEMVGQHFKKFVYPEDWESSIQNVQKMVTAGSLSGFENRYIHKEGHLVELMWLGSWSESNRMIYASARDNSERKKAEERLKRSEELYRTVVENFPNGGISLLDRQYTFTFIAGQELQELNLSPSDIIGQRFSDFFDAATAARLLKTLQQTFEGQYVQLEIPYQGKIYLCYTVPLYEGERVTHMMLVFQNVTLLKEAEARLQDYAHQLEKTNSELDQFVYKTSHDLRAPLVSVLGLIYLAKAERETAEQHHYLALMEKSIKRLDNFIKDIIDFSKSARTELSPELIDFPSLIQDSLEGLRYMEDAQSMQISQEIAHITDFYSDKRRLEMILHNIIANAIRYKDPRKEKPCICIRVKSISEQVVQLSIEDNGLGIAPEHHSKIFNMFYRAAETKTGSGLGLYIVKENILKLKGSIEVQSVPGKGSTFSLQLPSLQL